MNAEGLTELMRQGAKLNGCWLPDWVNRPRFVYRIILENKQVIPVQESAVYAAVAKGYIREICWIGGARDYELLP